MKITLADWQTSPESQILPSILSFVADFRAWDPTDPLTPSRIASLSWDKQRRIAEAHGWKIRKGNAVEDLRSRASMRQSLLRMGDAAAREFLSKQSAPDLKSMAEVVGFSSAYLNRKQGTGEQWIVNGRTLSRNELEVAIQSAIQARNAFIRATAELTAERDGLLEKTSGIEISRPTADRLAFLVACIKSDRITIATHEANPKHSEWITELRERIPVHESELASLKESLSGPLAAIGFDGVQRLGFLTGILPKRAEMLAGMDDRITDMRDLLTISPHKTLEPDFKPSDRSGQLALDFL